MNETDLELLRCYASNHTDEAFAEIVRRHVNLVYSAAFRQVRSPQLAEEVSQSVFCDLACNARKLARDTILTAWLYQVTRRTAIDVVRREARRQLREQIAIQMNATNATADDWVQVEPLLDEAMSALDATDRAAVLLRYFENKSLREVGAQLGVSDDAAQKRVSRAIERLRDFFSKRGVAIGASGLVAVVSANAVQAAPVGLGTAIVAATALAGAASATTVTATVTKAIAMTTLQKSIVGTAFVAAVATGIYEARQVANARDAVKSLQQQQAPLADQVAQLTRERDEARQAVAALRDDNARLNRDTTELAKLRGENARLRDSAHELAQIKSSADHALDGTARLWAARVKSLIQRLQEKPDENIPELSLLTDAEWLEAMKNVESLQTDGDFRQATGILRNRAKETLGKLAREAFKKYAEANDGMLPTDFTQLKPYFERPAEDGIFKRYELRQSGKLSEVPKNEFLFAEIAPHVDVDNDSTYQFGMNTTRSTTVAGALVLDATVQFAQANNDMLPTDPAQLTPYLKQPVDPAKVQKTLSGIPPNITTLAQMRAAGMLK